MPVVSIIHISITPDRYVGCHLLLEGATDGKPAVRHSLGKSVSRHLDLISNMSIKSYLNISLARL